MVPLNEERSALDARILEHLAAHGVQTCGEIARAVQARPDLVDARLEELRLDDRVEFMASGGRIRWRLRETGSTG